MTHKPQSRAQAPVFRVTKAKQRVLTFLAEYFCLRVYDLAYLSRGRTPNENDKRTMRYTLKLLYEEGLVFRLRYFEETHDTGSATYAYGLSDKGVAMMRGLYENCKTFDEHSLRTLDHELEISYFHIALKEFCTKHGLALYWQQSDLKRTVHPDALFAITDAKKPAGKDTLYYFLEIERAKIGAYRNGEPSIMRKLGKMHEYYDSDLCKKEWASFKQFRVIVVQPTDERRKNLLNQLHEQFNHRMFWLTTEDAYKHDIGGEIFKTPKDHQDKAYSFLSQ